MEKKQRNSNFGRIPLQIFLGIGMLLTVAGCEERWDTPEPFSPDDTLEPVTLTIGFADTAHGLAHLASPRSATEGDNDTPPMGADATTSPYASGAAAASPLPFEAALLPAPSTKASSATPDRLYNLEVYQYDAAGTFQRAVNLGTVAPGSPLTLDLLALTDCQLIFLARGSTGAAPSLNGKSLATVQNEVVASASVIDGLTDLKAMPYLLHLKHVHISDGKIRNPEEKDVRVQLKRLAVRLGLSWSISAEMQQSGYTLKEIRLCQVPKDYRVLPAAETTAWGTAYPVSSAEFIDKFRLTDNLTDAGGKGSLALWIPANARGRSSKATSALYRSKENAPEGASYLELVVDNATLKERLYYRAYLGGEETTDFNLYENTDYQWSVRIQSPNYTADPRIRLLDQTPVISSNLVPTANCFMLKPGTNICFNPYRHSAGTNGWNDFLVATPDVQPAPAAVIDQVKVLWQTKDAGTIGDLIMGYVIDEDHHENLVNLTAGEGLESARIHLKVPQSKGGNAVIAAYAKGAIVWSWHVWATDYEPQPIHSYAGYAAAQQNSRQGTVHKYDSPLFEPGGVYENRVMMDRDLGARTGGYPALTAGKGTEFTTMDAVNTYGLLYQWGRKDPFFNSLDGTNNEKDVIYDGYGRPVNIVKVPMSQNVGDKMAYSIAHPLAFYYEASSTDWYTPAEGRWNAPGADNRAPGVKGLHDPCPYGWKVPMMCDVATSSVDAAFMQAHTIFTEFARTDQYGIIVNNTSAKNYQFTKFLYFLKGELQTNVGENADPRLGRIFLIGNTTAGALTIHNSVWVPATAERRGHASAGDFGYAGQYGHIWCADIIGSGGAFMGYRGYDVEVMGYSRRVGWPLRCIQDTP